MPPPPEQASGEHHPPRNLQRALGAPVLFPLPPAQHELYTDENLQLYQEMRRLVHEGLVVPPPSAALEDGVLSLEQSEFAPLAMHLDPPALDFMRGKSAIAVFGQMMPLPRALVREISPPQDPDDVRAPKKSPPSPSVDSPGRHRGAQDAKASIPSQPENTRPVSRDRMLQTANNAITHIVDHLGALASDPSQAVSLATPATHALLELMGMTAAYREHQALETVDLVQQFQIDRINALQDALERSLNHVHEVVLSIANLKEKNYDHDYAEKLLKCVHKLKKT